MISWREVVGFLILLAVLFAVWNPFNDVDGEKGSLKNFPHCSLLLLKCLGCFGFSTARSVSLVG
jgi:hypothetical protein